VPGQSALRRRVQVTAPNGVTWTRSLGGHSSPEMFLAALSESHGLYRPEREWNWWREGQAKQERDRVMSVVLEWENGAPAQSEEAAAAWAEQYLRDMDAEWARERRNRKRRAARRYDPDMARDRLSVLRLESDAAFFRHVAAAPLSPEQRVDAERRAEKSIADAAEIRARMRQDLEQVLDADGFTPAERREHNLSSHVHLFRHRTLREWSTSDKRRFAALLSMPALSAEDMCSECQAPAAWHDYDISLRLFQPAPEPGSRTEALDRLMPGWWQRCPACTAYKVSHVWGGSHALPGFTGEQYLGMLPPLLKSIFGPAPRRRPRTARPPQPKPLVTIPAGLALDDVVRRLSQAKERHPTAEVRQGPGGSWELWPGESP
jgi:hypothetical protein